MRILIVEDEPDTAQSMAVLLRLSGHDVHIVCDGCSALSSAEKRPPDVVLLDIGLPSDMDGWEVVRRLREMRFPHRPQVIAVTGHDAQAERKKSYEAGIDFHFAKPVDLEELNKILERLERSLP